MSRGFGRYWEPRPFGAPFGDPWEGVFPRRRLDRSRPVQPTTKPQPAAASRRRPVVVPIHPSPAPPSPEAEPPSAPESGPAPREPLAPAAPPPLEPLVPDRHDELERAKERIARQARLEGEQDRRQLIASFLEVLDDLDRALDAARAAGDEDALMRGVEMVRASFLAKLAQQGVVPSDELGKTFDPEHHEALTTVPVADPADRGRVVGVLRPGYTIDGELLRPAGVAVGS